MGAAEARALARLRALREMGVLACSQSLASLDVLPDTPAGPDLVHAFSAHTPLWAYEHPDYAKPIRQEFPPPPVFEELDPASPPEVVLAKTRFVVFVGASASPLLERVLAEPGVFVLLCEPDPARLARFLERVPPQRLVNKALVLLGELADFSPPLSAQLSSQHFALGFPVFYVPQDGDDGVCAYARRVIEFVEVLFFRLRVYPLSSQSLGRSLPLRNIVQELFYDQQVHAYAGALDHAACPDIGALAGLFRGETAILVAAGADLTSKVEYLRANRDRAVIIAVNSALKPLVQAGVLPHFVVVNDTSLAVDKTFEGLPLLRPVILVAHCLSCLGGDVFPKRFLFGNHRPEVFGPRPELRLHGSVLTTAFSLARHLGATTCVLVGAQLSSADPWSLQYATGATGLGDTLPTRERIDRYPQLYPVATPFGETRFTSLNFLDVKHWMAEEFRSSGMRCVNTTRESIVYWEGVAFDPAPDIAPTGRLTQALRQAFAATRRNPPLAAARAYLEGEIARLSAFQRLLPPLNHMDEPDFIARGMQLLALFDASNVTYLVHRYKNFSNPQFCFDLFQARDGVFVATGLEAYFSNVCAMLGDFLAQLRQQVETLRQRLLGDTARRSGGD